MMNKSLIDTLILKANKKYNEKNPSLKNWHESEMKYPNIFQGMYQFWVKKD